jgi:hypothetical protein
MEKDSVNSFHSARATLEVDSFGSFDFVTESAYFLYASEAFTTIVWTFEDVTGFTSDQFVSSVQVKESFVAYKFADAGYDSTVAGGVSFM